MRRWIGFDLDGTMAKVDMSRPYDGTIGEPIKPAIRAVLLLHEIGWDVRVFTARVASPLQRWEGYGFPCEEYAIRHQRQLIREWTQEHIGIALEATAVKDHLCVAILDDRAIAVRHNEFICYQHPWLLKQVARAPWEPMPMEVLHEFGFKRLIDLSDWMKGAEGQ